MEMNAKRIHGATLYAATWADKYPLVFILALLQFLRKLCTLKVTEACISTASSFYSACGYAVREKKGVKKYLLIGIGGGGSLFFATVAVWWKFFITFFKQHSVWHYFQPTDLDVLGSIFTQAKFYRWARFCFRAIRRNLLSSDVTIALAYKWYSQQPLLSSSFVDDMRDRVTCLINLHPEWDATILSRLYPFIGDRQNGIELRREVTRKAIAGEL